LYFINADTGFIPGYYPAQIFKTTDGGFTWLNTNISNPFGGFHSITFNNASTGIAIGNYFRFYKTTDSGDNWFPDNYPDTNKIYGNITSDITGKILIVGNDGVIVR